VPFPDILPHDPIHLGGATFLPVQGAIVVLSAVLMAGLILLIHRTRLGRAMRATAENPAVSRLMGVDVDRVISFTFVLGSAL
ncbi:hypothetical protein ABTE59_19530, partial [Acinetobacter baumannii]